jgi:hypothetical protein
MLFDVDFFSAGFNIDFVVGGSGGSCGKLRMGL